MRKDLQRLIKLAKLQHDLLLSVLEEESKPKNSSGVDPIWSTTENLIRLQSIMIPVQQIALDGGEDVIPAAQAYCDLLGLHHSIVTGSGNDEKET